MNIGIIALGWLGEELAKEYSETAKEVWGTTRNNEKQSRISGNAKINVVIWKNDEGISVEMQEKLSITDLLILNLPPSVFQNETYAEGLVKFLPYLKSDTKVIFTSSTSVYPSHLIDAVESYVFKKDEINKIGEAEIALQSKLNNRLTILRLSGLIGEDRNPVHYLIKKETNDHPDRPVNLAHRKDIIKIISKVTESDYFGEILNVCHPEHPTRKNYYTEKARQLNLPEPHFSQSILGEQDKVVNCHKLMNKLDYKSFVPL
ncbi:MAG: hypothetical protein ACSHXL_03530 [Bacteroidota bacterium]